MKARTFWLVWCPTHGAPHHRHQSRPSAVAEANRLAVENPGCEFFVLASVGMAVKQSVVWVDHEEDVEIPF